MFIYCIYTSILKATTRKSIQSDILKNTIDKLKYNLKRNVQIVQRNAGGNTRE